MRERFERKLTELRDDILAMGSRVEEELKVALNALEKLDTDLAKRVYEIDKEVNATRFEIEEKCFTLIVTQQPAAGDLRAIIAVMNMIVDLERMGDQTKGIAKVIPHMMQYADKPHPSELREMGLIVGNMLHDTMTAYAQDNIDLAELVVNRDDEVDRLYAQIFTKVMEEMAQADSPDKIEASYEVLRAARELERFGDLATNIAERVIYRVTGHFQETNLDDQNE